MLAHNVQNRWPLRMINLYGKPWVYARLAFAEEQLGGKAIEQLKR